MTPAFALFFVIFLEGYAVLSTELLAIRLLVPFTGSGTDTVSIIIAAVLLPLAFGYSAGGHFKKTPLSNVRHQLLQNLTVAITILTFGLSYVFLNSAFNFAQKAWHLNNRLVITALYAAVFVVTPVYLLGQTVPLISHYFSRRKIAHIAGRMLFFSTLGSFMGAIFATLVLMTHLGVHNTALITLASLVVVVVVVSPRRTFRYIKISLMFLALAVFLNGPWAMKGADVVGNNTYNLIQITEDDDKGTRVLRLNHTEASAVYTDNAFRGDQVFDYVAFVDENFIAPARDQGPEKSMLILGAGGFTIGRTDIKNKYVYVDIDSALKDVAERQFLKENLTPNKTFIPMDARAFLIQSQEKYDFILVDLFRDPVSMPENVITREFFEEVKKHLAPGGVMAANVFASAVFADDYSRNIDATLRAVFPVLNRQVVQPFSAWAARDKSWRNIIYSAFNRPAPPPVVYTDDKNTAVFDRPADVQH